MNQKVLESREVCRVVDADQVADGLEAKDGDGFDDKVGDQDIRKTLELLSVGDFLLLDLVLFENLGAVKNVPGQTAAKVHDLVDNEKKKASGEKVAANPGVVGRPDGLEP